MFEETMKEFSVPEVENVEVSAPVQTGGADDGIDLSDTSNESMDARIERLFAWGGDQSTQPAKQPEATPNPAQATPTAPVTGSQQNAAPIDPAKAFEDASKTAFFSDGGDLDTAKINDFYLTNGKSLLKYAAPITTIGAVPTIKEKVESVDPEKEYENKAKWVFENLDEVIADQKKRGFTDADIPANIQRYMADLAREKEAKLEMKRTIAEEAKRFAPEFEQARQARISAAIDRNTTELSAGLNGLIPGLDGKQVLNQFILNKKYGGEYVNHLFNKEHPGAIKLPEPQRAEIVEKWFSDFQQNRESMAYAAEFGRLRWMAENFKPILEHAQKIGAEKVTNQREARGFAPSGLTSQHKTQSGSSTVEQFFNNGMDSVN